MDGEQTGGLLVRRFGAIAAPQIKELKAQGWRPTDEATGAFNEMMKQAAVHDRQGLEVGFATAAGCPVALYQVYIRKRRRVSQAAFLARVEEGARVTYRRADPDGPGIFITDDSRVDIKPNRIGVFLAKLDRVMPGDEHGRLSRAVYVEQGIVQGCFTGPNHYL